MKDTERENMEVAASFAFLIIHLRVFARPAVEN